MYIRISFVDDTRNGQSTCISPPAFVIRRGYFVHVYKEALFRIRDLEDWPPKPSESNDSSAAPRTEQDVIKKVVHVQTNWMIFECESIDDREDQRAYYFQLDDEMTLQKFKVILEENVGNRLLSIGDVEIAAGQAAW